MIVSPSFADPPLAFTRVCQSWRDVAYATSEIWSRIQLLLPDSGGTGQCNSELFLPSLLKLWLAHSGNQPLTLVIRCLSSTCELLHTTVISQVLEILLSEKGRWEAVALRLHGCGRNWSRIIDTPRLRAMECDWSDLLRGSESIHRICLAYASLNCRNISDELLKSFALRTRCFTFITDCDTITIT
jgi:hypothetical protein